MFSRPSGTRPAKTVSTHLLPELQLLHEVTHWGGLQLGDVMKKIRMVG